MPDQTVEPREHYVYALYREDGVTPFYIGMGKGPRWTQHETMLRYQKRNHKWHIIKSMADRGITVPKAKLAEGMTVTEAQALEVRLIAEIGREPDGPLVNISAGGEGITGLPAHIIEARGKSLSDTYARRPELRAQISEVQRTRKRGPRSHETKAKLRAANLGKSNWHKVSDEAKARMRAALMARQEAMRIARQLRWDTDPEFRASYAAKKSAARKLAWARDRENILLKRRLKKAATKSVAHEPG